MTGTTRNIVERFGSLDNAIEAAEAVAARLLADYDDSGVDWAAKYIAKAGVEAHIGACEKARWWQQAPTACAACVYDEFMAKAWEELGVVHA